MVALLAGGLASGCATEQQVRLLDDICSGVNGYYNTPPAASSTTEPACRLEGDARETTAISADSIGFQLGPATGSLIIRLNAIPAALQGGTWSLDVLTASSRAEGSTLYRTITWGSCGGACPADPADSQAELNDDFAWVPLVVDQPGYVPNSGEQLLDDATLILTGADIDIVDVRTPGYDPYNFYYY